MSVMTDTANLMNQPGRIRALRRAVETIADGAAPLVDLCRPYVDGLDHLPRDGRFLLVGNHTQSGTEGLLIPYAVRRELGTLVRPLTDRAFGRMPGPAADLLAACGATVGAPESARELMRHDQPILVFPGGGREIGKFKGEENTLNWRGRAGFARIAAEHDYPIVPAGLIGGDDVYRSFTTRDGAWGRLSAALSSHMAGKPDMAMPLVRGIGPTMIPRPQRMYLRFAEPIDSTRPAGVAADDWAESLKTRTQESLEAVLAQLLQIRAADPYRQLNPLAWRDAVQP
ncbi:MULTISPECIES: lysophospholipid acyltransferase family protein [Mycobacteriaceae]|uniref:Glycerol acyltransferase n=1 Tax=Mycolicibacterium neoaurum VKM Ac-1815D TaxID=700508 RepID=V5XI28_MYCNE|nr:MULTISPECIES: lysophospholipid acyltransferase family protein [Mycobacteriaceae]AHC27647.1 glycerol acyltransferase [Mycolicibacterium neoaurum VKM Ac-1815D]AMO07831.1 glycerol acyltransferase [Mycolicibacterium neoaurum]AXK73765.1 acyltransferase family protein [Mycolicibacterium neoaurum]KJQ49663.1 glycerol acyltransferase [Mycolicibacterium neoaurum]KUM07159.1 glycerol acyltransferase [Mycolicibacterium neoaurum]